MIVTTSWDDGYTNDLRIADLLERFGATGTFYICPTPQHDQHMLNKQQIKTLQQHHEIGAHTLNHTKLSRIDLQQAVSEIQGSKTWVEEATGKECAMFCYPCGDYNNIVRDAVIAAGFVAARTVEQLCFRAENIFELPTSIHLYPFPWRPKYTRLAHIFDPLAPLRVKWKQLNQLHIPLRARSNWQALARSLFLYAYKTDQPFFHLWGHAYELDRYKLWGELESFFSFVSQYSVEYRTNGDLAKFILQQK